MRASGLDPLTLGEADVPEYKAGAATAAMLPPSVAGKAAIASPRMADQLPLRLEAVRAFLAKRKDWSIGGTLVALETYNGIGYANKGRPSPYLWAGTDQYVSGKYVRDNVYDPNAVDQQPGTANLLKAMMALDPTITFTGAKIIPMPKPVPAPPPRNRRRRA